ncbi:hypothetical protein PMIP48 (plasmid) [Proteus mirabilis HI4320]|uniref:Uncharacterized protein n=1 Tax=Proteus mirabilis (strain HI4320) TaxID=529507 RepID=B1VJ88_PROMH|nr:hypothetical protein PMIP48 [Proteus mirabilis HI4320]
MSATVRLWRGGQPVNGNGGCSGGASAGLAFPDTSPPLYRQIGVGVLFDSELLPYMRQRHIKSIS